MCALKYTGQTSWQVCVLRCNFKFINAQGRLAFMLLKLSNTPNVNFQYQTRIGVISDLFCLYNDCHLKTSELKHKLVHILPQLNS